MIHVLSGRRDSYSYVYPDMQEELIGVELFCSCGKSFANVPLVPLSVAWDAFEAHRKESITRTVVLRDILDGLYNLDNSPVGPSTERVL